MAKAQQYISEYDAALASFNKAVEDYNKTLDAYEASFYQGGVMVGDEESTYPGFDLGGGYFVTNYPGFGMVGRKPTSIRQGIATIDPETEQFIVRDPQTGVTVPIRGSGMQYNENIVVTASGHIMEFSPKPGDFTQTAPSFDMEKYKSLLNEDFTTEQKAIQDAFAKTQAEEKAKFEAQRMEMERQAAIAAAENARAEDQARASFAQAQAEAATAQAERDTKTKQFKDETEASQRDIGARRAGYVRARRMRSRSLLSGA